MRVDHQLDLSIAGMLGSFWTRQTDATTRDMVKTVASTAVMRGDMSRLDETAGSMVGDPVMVRHRHFVYTDGNYAFLGRSPTDFASPTVTDTPGIRDGSSPLRTTVPKAGPLSDLPAGFLDLVAKADWLALDVDWYFIPLPTGLIPIVIEASKDTFLTANIDFWAFDGFLIMRDNPSAVLPRGAVHVPLALSIPPQPYSFTLEAPEKRFGNKWLAEYRRKTQSVAAFRRAAAEYCGLFVLPVDDLLLHSGWTGTGRTYYWANAGAVTIDYPHFTLRIGNVYPAGTVVAQCFEFFTPADNPLSDYYGTDVLLDNVLPVKGCRFTIGTPVDIWAYNDHTTIGLLTLDPAALNSRQAQHEESNNMTLTSYVGYAVEFDEFLEDYYGNSLLSVAAVLDDTRKALLDEFLDLHRPAGCALLILRPPETPPGDYSFVTLNNHRILLDGDPVTYTPFSFIGNPVSPT